MNLDPLATYLEPQFGDIYDDTTTWTPELRDAVTNYLLHEVANEDYAAFLDELLGEVPGGSRAAQAAFIIERRLPWRVAYAFHTAAVKAVSTFQQLMESLSAVWDYEDWKSDARYWFDAHATDEELREVARRLSVSASVPRQQAGIQYEDLADYLTDTVKPEMLLRVWKQMATPELTDLTDQEWTLLDPLIPRAANASTPTVVRQAIDGMLWRQAHPGFAPVPARYGSGTLINARKHNYKQLGVFARMLAGLEGKPGAERLVAWLREVLGVESER